ncbi:MAG TPA: carbohydrate kinase family protein [Roseiflexaceae bacterium]|nr:carbohydrate kinase family protein [Roseiflexaceae bacterium]HMP40536.1 carbohydrate kinase family protein [Roseiflexaceae bacterium]
MAYDLVVLGDLVADLIVPIERLPLLPNQHGWAEGIFVEPGGAGNVLVAARRLDLATAAVGGIGSDRYGHEMCDMLQDVGVDTSHVQVCAERQTVVCMVIADTAGQHVYLGIKDQLGRWPYEPAWDTVISSARALFTDGYTLRDVLDPDVMIAALSKARAAGVPVFFDPGPSIMFVAPEVMQRAIALADVLLLTDEEAAYLCTATDRAAVAHALLAYGPGMVVLKHGADGCSVADADGVIHCPGFPITVVDTVGAGDSFAAALIAGLLRGATPAVAATLANAMGALVATRRGAGTRIPSRAEWLAFLHDKPDLQALG